MMEGNIEVGRMGRLFGTKRHPVVGMLLAWCAMAFPAVGSAEDVAAGDDAAGSRMREHVKVLSAPEMEGRGPGTAGIEEAASYIESQFKQAGLEPGGDTGSYRQSFTPDRTKIRNEEFSPPNGWDGIELVNLVGVIPGSSPAGGCLVVGAHYDHLGRSEEGAPYPGADDNASGVAILLELASRLSEQGPLRRSVVLVAFSGEEQGTLGSLEYLRRPACPLDQTVAMLNLDTVGRMDARKLLVLGSASGAEWADVLKGINLGFGFNLEMPAHAPFASDHVPFFEKGIPVLHFFTGPNADYHRLSDTQEKISFADLADLSAFVQELAIWLADGDDRITFVPPGAAAAAPMVPQGPPRRTSLGGIPDFGRESGGVLLAGTVPGTPAEKAGLRKGDVLISLGGAPVDNLGDYSAALKAHQPGDTVEVVVMREGTEVRFEVELIERK